jgi:hypothetical protein
MTEPEKPFTFDPTFPASPVKPARDASASWFVLVIGIILFVHHFAMWIDIRIVGPSLCIALGVYLILNNQRKNRA